MSDDLPPRPGGSGLLAPLAEIALSIGGYYLLRACGAGVFWALTAPAMVIAAAVAVLTVRRRRLDLIGLLVLIELAVTIALSLITRSPRIAAVREPLYLLAGGVFCLLTLLLRRPFTDRTTVAFASFGDPKREAAFAYAWRALPRYRGWQRALTATIGTIMIMASGIRIAILATAPSNQIAHAVNVSTLIGTSTYIAIVVASALMIQPVRVIIERLLTETNPSDERARNPA